VLAGGEAAGQHPRNTAGEVQEGPQALLDLPSQPLFKSANIVSDCRYFAIQS